MTGPVLTGLDLVRDQLAEARRFTHTKPSATEHMLGMAIGNLALDRRQLDHRRIVENLIVGLGAIHAAPDATDAAITLSLWELGDLASRLRKADEAEARDAELMDAYGPRTIDPTEEG